MLNGASIVGTRWHLVIHVTFIVAGHPTWFIRNILCDSSPSNRCTSRSLKSHVPRKKPSRDLISVRSRIAASLHGRLFNNSLMLVLGGHVHEHCGRMPHLRGHFPKWLNAEPSHGYLLSIVEDNMRQTLPDCLPIFLIPRLSFETITSLDTQPQQRSILTDILSQARSKAQTFSQLSVLVFHFHEPEPYLVKHRSLFSYIRWNRYYDRLHRQRAWSTVSVCTTAYHRAIHGKETTSVLVNSTAIDAGHVGRARELTVC